MIDMRTLKADEDVQENVTYRRDATETEYITLKRFHWGEDRSGNPRLRSMEVVIDTGAPRLGSTERREPEVMTTGFGDRSLAWVEEYANLLLEAIALARSLK